MNWKLLIMKQPKTKMRRNRTALMRLSHDGGGRFAIGIALNGRCAIVGVFNLNEADRLFLERVLMDLQKVGFKANIEYKALYRKEGIDMGEVWQCRQELLANLIIPM